MQRILVVEDDFDIQELLQNFLQEAGYEVAVANDGVEALSLFAGQRYDLIVLDIMLPKIDGYGVCELIRKQSDVPIIMLTALSGEEDQIKGLDLQVDDYITKPFSMPVLLRKIAAVLRRSNRETDEKYQIITYGNLLLNCDSYTATVDGANFELTQKEFEILRELLTHQGRILTRQNLLDKLWRYDFYGDERVVDTHIKNLRKKLGIDFIQTIRGGDIKLIKRIKGSLFAKVFILTVAVLLCVSFLVYGVLAWYMPQTYSNNLNAALDEQTSDFIYELEHIRMQDSGGLFDQFLQNTTISMVELYTADGVLVETPSNQNSFNDGITGEALGGASYESAPIISNSYYFSFADDNSQYILTVYGEASQIAELRQSFVSVLPILFCVILLVSLATAWVYSRIITNPVLKISRISKEMSDMRLEWQLEERRSDELGVLENSLNTLSRKLSATLEELQSANLQLQKDIEHQKALERAQQDFFSSASHELKTPITIIKGQLEGMLLGIGAYKDHEKYLARSLEVAATLETMVQEILTISRLETNVDFKMEHFDCAPMIHGYLREIDDLVATKELQIHLDIQSPAFINGNKLLIEKVFSNLISNAVKYSPHGASVDIILQNTNGRFLFSVENTGTHIPEDDIPKLFDAFYRMEQSRSRRTGGSGLGLYMVQRILQQHNSYCEACNTENGVKFFFTI